MASLEKILLSALNFNDEIKLSMESLNFIPAQAKAKLAENPNADGVLLVEEPQFTPSYFEIQLRVVNAKTNIDEALTTVGEVIDVLTACAKIDGGAEIEWTPAESVQAYTAYALLGELLEIPITPSGDLAGWFVKFPVLKIKLTCRPFLFQDERVVLSLVESTGEPLQIAYIKGIQGDVPAEARLLVKDTASADRRFGQWGRDAVETETNPPLLLTVNGGGLVGTNASGVAATRVGAYGAEKVLRGIAVLQATSLCTTGRIEHVGSFAVYMRVYTPSSTSLFRLSYRNGDSLLTFLDWQLASISAEWTDVFMGEVSLDEVERGLQTSELRVEQRSTSGNPLNDINFLTLIPTTEGGGKARGVALNTATNLVAFDNFEQAVGNLEGKELPFPTATVWASAEKTGASGFLINATKHCAERAIKDASVTAGAYALAGTTKYTTSLVQVDMFNSFPFAGGFNVQRFGVVARYTNTENWIMAALTWEVVAEESRQILYVFKRVAGTITQLARFVPTVKRSTSTISLSVTSAGIWTASAYQPGAAAPVGGNVAGFDAAFAVGGALQEGRMGLYDAMTATEVRQYDNFQMLGVEEPSRVCYSGRQVEFNSAGCQRQDATGIYMGTPSVYRGAGFYLEPAGKLGLINRLAVRMRRNDVAVESDLNVTDKQAIEVLARERYLAPRS